MAAGAVVARILTQYSDKGSKQAQKDIAKLGKNIDAFGKKANKAFLAAGVATAYFAVKIGKDAVSAAIEDSKSQAILANNLRNVTGATDESIKSVEEYISKQQMLANVSDTELRASFSQLVLATGDVTTAMDLQSTALDTAAGSGKDLGTVSAAIAKAATGNFTALKRLIPTLDANIVKNKDLGAALEFLDRKYKGSAKTLGNTDPLKKLQLAYGEVLETRGYALLPVVKEFAEYVRTDVLPAIEDWVKINNDKLAQSFKVTLNVIASIVKGLVELITFFEKYKTIALIVGAIPVFASIVFQLDKLYKVYTRLMPVVNAVFSKKTIGTLRAIGSLLGTVGKVFKAGGVLAGFKTLGTLIGMISPHVKVIMLLAAGVGILAVVLNKIFGGSDKVAKNVQTASEKAGRATEHAARRAAAITAANKKRMADLVKETQEKKNQAAIDAKAIMDAKRKAAIEANIAVVKKKIASMTGVKITDQDEYDLIQLTAVQKLQAKQKDADESLQERIKLRKEELAIFNSLTAKTAQYLEFLKAINSDGRLDDSELVNLMSKWNLTQTAASKYADFVYAIGDRKLSDTEIENLKSKWGMTTKEVIAYLAKIGAPVDAKGTALSAGDIAALGWKNASSALDAYNAKLKSSGAGPVTSAPPTINPPTPNPVQDLIDREMAIDKPFMPGDFGYLFKGGQSPNFAPPASPLTGSSLFGGGIDYSKIFRSSTFDNGMDLMSGAMSNSNSPTINLAVYGSVTTEQDLVQTIRQGLLQGQSSGYGLLLQEI